ncbi:hypothetical protein NDU88_000073 [Pleurodeles waltl]|uniref:Secreted protein n=1 Tax=Pleurodeles waltl TaxID=8319 RepID=A0AAV7SVE8_PLEWA|nr:hypothetical protein NDU88_000073 [Pleurodeles waltl]
MEAAKALVIRLVGAIQSAAVVMRPGDSPVKLAQRPRKGHKQPPRRPRQGPVGQAWHCQTGGADSARAQGHTHFDYCFRTPRALEATHRCCKKLGLGDLSVAAGAASAAADPEVILPTGLRGGSKACEGLRRR